MFLTYSFFRYDQKIGIFQTEAHPNTLQTGTTDVKQEGWGEPCLNRKNTQSRYEDRVRHFA